MRRRAGPSTLVPAGPLSHRRPATVSVEGDCHVAGYATHHRPRARAAAGCRGPRRPRALDPQQPAVAMVHRRRCSRSVPHPQPPAAPHRPGGPAGGAQLWHGAASRSGASGRHGAGTQWYAGCPIRRHRSALPGCGSRTGADRPGRGRLARAVAERGHTRRRARPGPPLDARQGCGPRWLCGERRCDEGGTLTPIRPNQMFDLAAAMRTGAHRDGRRTAVAGGAVRLDRRGPAVRHRCAGRRHGARPDAAPLGPSRSEPPGAGADRRRHIIGPPPSPSCTAPVTNAWTGSAPARRCLPPGSPRPGSTCRCFRSAR